MFRLLTCICVFCTILLVQCRYDHSSFVPTGQHRNDSAGIQQLMGAVLRWRQSQQDSVGADLPYKIQHPGDSLFTGIDWPAFDRRQAVLKGTQLFSKELLENMHAIAARMDDEIARSGRDYRSNTMVSIFEPEGDHWCGCFEYPGKNPAWQHTDRWHKRNFHMDMERV